MNGSDSSKCLDMSRIYVLYLFYWILLCLMSGSPRETHAILCRIMSSIPWTWSWNFLFKGTEAESGNERCDNMVHCDITAKLCSMFHAIFLKQTFSFFLKLRRLHSLGFLLDLSIFSLISWQVPTSCGTRAGHGATWAVTQKSVVIHFAEKKGGGLYWVILYTQL